MQAIYLDCVARRPQLKRGPLGSPNLHLSPFQIFLAIILPAVWFGWLITRVSRRDWKKFLGRDWKEAFGPRLPSVEEDIQRIEQQAAEDQRERDRLREVSHTDLEAAQQLRNLLKDDLAKAQEVIAYYQKRLRKHPEFGSMVNGFCEDEQALVTEIETLASTIERLSSGAGAA